MFDENDTVVGNCEFSVNDQLFFETLIMLLSGECISYSSFKKKQTVNDEKNLERKIEILEHSVVTSNDKLSILKEIDDKKLQLESLRLKIYNGIITRSRIKWMEFGEKPSRYFLNLEKQNKVNKEIRKLSTENGEVIDGQNEILNEIFNFYSKLYEARETEEVDLNTLNLADVPNYYPLNWQI